MNDEFEKTYTEFVSKYLELHPGEAAVMLNNREPVEVLSLFNQSPIGIVIPVFSRLNPALSTQIVQMADQSYFLDLYSEVEPDTGAKILSRLTPEERHEKLSLLPDKIRLEIEEFLSYPPRTAGSFMDPKVNYFFATDSVEKTMKYLLFGIISDSLSIAPA